MPDIFVSSATPFLTHLIHEILRIMADAVFSLSALGGLDPPQVRSPR